MNNSKGEILSAGDLNIVIMYVLPAVKFIDPPSRYTTKFHIITRISHLDKHWSEYMPKKTEIEVVEDVEVIVEGERTDEEVVEDAYCEMNI